MITTQFAIDQGNTRTKLAVFNGRETLLHCIYEGENQEEQVIEKILELKISSGILSTVRTNPDEFYKSLAESSDVILEGPNLKLPFSIDYDTPETLGSDRKANASAFVGEFGSSNGLIIDFGSCITYSVVQKGTFSGGAISPGIAMRYKALGDYTGRLPHLKPIYDATPILGKTTEGSLRSGVEVAVLGEVEKMIGQYCSHINDLVVIGTGGDLSFFERHLKSPIFARSLYTLTGLNEIFLINTK